MKANPWCSQCGPVVIDDEGRCGVCSAPVRRRRQVRLTVNNRAADFYEGRAREPWGHRSAYQQQICLVREGLRRLRGYGGQVLALIYRDGLDQDEVADKLWLSRERVSRLHDRAIERLRKYAQSTGTHQET